MNRFLKIALVFFISLLVITFLTLLPNINRFTEPLVPILSYSTSEYANSKNTNTLVKMLFLGDIMLARTIGSSIQNGDDPFKNINKKFSEYDVIVGNLETVASDPKYAVQASGKLFTFNSPIESIDVLKRNKIEIVSLANNHTMDYGSAALVNTMENLKSRGILYVGAGNNINEAFSPKYLNYKGTIIALLAFNDIENWFADATDYSAGSAFFNKDRIRNSLIEANEKADIVIVMPHWGIEYSLTNSQRQQEFGHFFIDNGADVVIGAHPHVEQNEEEYNGKKIYYSLGNFVFDDMCSIPNACDASILEIVIEDKQLISSSSIKVKLQNNGYPELK